MKNKNMLRPVIEEITYNGTMETQRIKNNYTNASTITNGLILPSSIQSSSSGTGTLQTEVTFDKYNAQGKPLQITLKNGRITVYLWSYNYQYPIAEIKNATYESVKAALGETLINRVAKATTPATADITTINNLRSNTALKAALITTYTYKPLVGMLTATDPSGITTYYDYDSFGRLKETYLIEGGVKKIVQSYNYHYKNQ
ncbi:hypothetical protein [Dysgonomonas sp. 521]|uniref:hypothetical protein n=1 Tax=Dysgonomonas sp. 521 TaxID=2302932 RepID=UPI0013D4FD8C|nr:hypothetical protein [Dysgonomonas sp. 521]